MLFLSYAKEDSASARRIAQWLRDHQFDVFDWQAPEQRGGQFIAEIERGIIEAEAFLALMSPSFAKSAYCHREAQLAIICEEELRMRQRGTKFISVLKVRDTRHLDTGFLATYDWQDAENDEDTNQVLTGIIRSLASKVKAGAAQPYIASPHFRNREDEMETVLRGLTNAGGQHFWLVLGPPQLGKTWFMDHLAAKLLAEPVEWATMRVDAREYLEEERSNVPLLLMDLFGLKRPAKTGQDGRIEADSLLVIAQSVLEREQPHLCLLDSAELLDDGTVKELRRCLCDIYHHVQDAGINDVRLALIVASRREDEWLGVVPAPRLAPLSLTQFRPDVIRGTLQELARKMHRNFAAADLDRNAARVYRLSEGLPALLALCLRWIQKEQWLRLERLETQQLFDTLATDYIREKLLSHDSLLPRGREDNDNDDKLRYVLECAFQALTPYRRFTQSHLHYHMESDPGFAAALVNPAWKGLLWGYLGKSTLLVQPLPEPWQQTQPAIRRLLFRYFNTTDEQRIEAHERARDFAYVWQAGNEPVIGVVEFLWHEAAILRLSGDPDMKGKLCDSARRLALSFTTNPLVTAADLRKSAAMKIRDDEEFRETVDNINGLFMKLAQIIESTEEP
jgi:TIR domain